MINEAIKLPLEIVRLITNMFGYKIKAFKNYLNLFQSKSFKLLYNKKQTFLTYVFKNKTFFVLITNKYLDYMFYKNNSL